MHNIKRGDKFIYKNEVVTIKHIEETKYYGLCVTFDLPHGGYQICNPDKLVSLDKKIIEQLSFDLN